MPRDLTVRVRADVGAYQKAMSAAKNSTDEFVQAGQRLQQVGMKVSNIGDNLTKNVTLPMALAGGVAIKMANDFDNSFTTMQTLAGVSADAVDGLKESVLELSGETGRAPQELADALYFLQSSGLDSAAAMKALEASAKASAVGLGSTEVIADAVSSAMLGYAESGLEAAEATDILIATARAGKAEPAELAGQMGRLIPIASELGISFDQVGGAIAALSTKGNNAEMATTQLVNVMSKLLKPSEQASKLLAEVGLSADGIRQMLAGKGLLGTLEELRARLGDAGFTKFLEDTQAIQGALGLLGGDLNKTKDIFDQVKESAGATDNAFATWAESMGAQNAKAFADFQVALIKVGEVLAPIASDVLAFVSQIAEAFSALPDSVQQGVIAFALVAAAMGPLLSIGGRLITFIGTSARMLNEWILPANSVSGAFSGAAVSTNRFASAIGALGKVGAVVGILVGLREVLGTIADDVDRADLSVLENQLLDLAETGDIAGGALSRFFEGIEGGIEGGRPQVQEDLEAIDDALAQLAARDPDAASEAFVRLKERLDELGFSASQIDDIFDTYQSALAEADTSNRTTGDAIEEATGAFDEQTGAIEEAKSALEEYADQLAAQFDPLFGMIDALHGARDAQADVTAAQQALNDALAGGDPTAITEAQQKYDDALRGAQGALLDVQQAQLLLNDKIATGDVRLEDAQKQMFDWAVQAGYTADQAAIMAGQLSGAADQARILGQEDPVVSVSQVGMSPVAADAANLKARLDAIPRTIDITARFTQIGVPGVGGHFQLRQHGGPVTAGQAYVVGEKQPELFVPNVPGTVWPSVPPMSTPAPFGGGGAAIALTVQVNNPIVASEREFERMVTSAANRGLASGEINLRGRRIT